MVFFNLVHEPTLCLDNCILIYEFFLCNNPFHSLYFIIRLLSFHSCSVIYSVFHFGRFHNHDANIYLMFK